MDTACQRWSPGRVQSWRRRRDGGFDPRRYSVRLISEAAAREWLLPRHYSGTFPAARLQAGMFDLTGDAPSLVGVAVLSVPASERVLTSVFPGLEPYTSTLELGRFCLADKVPANGETHMLAETFRLAAVAGIQGVVSFSDPVARTTATGQVIHPGHLGLIYQAKGAAYLGRGTPRTLILLPTGQVFSARAAQKIRAQERGHEAAERRLVALGACPLRAGERPAAWLARALEDIGARRLRHPGCHRYAFSLGVTRKARADVVIAPDRGPYPKWGHPAPVPARRVP